MENERILEKIEELMAQYGYSKYKLAKLQPYSRNGAQSACIICH